MDRISAIIVAVFCLIKLVIHIIADGNSGFQGDELLHIQTGNHLAWGYNEFPPFIGLLAFIQNLFNSQSVFVHHIFSHLATVLILIYVTKTVLALGGSHKAVFLALLCIVIGPGFGRSQQLFQPVVFSQLFWVLSFYFLANYVKLLDKRYLWYLTFSVAIAFLTKYDALFFMVGLSSLLLFKKTRIALIRHKFWINILVFLLLITPNLIWQYLNDFPVLKMFSRLYETQLDFVQPLDVVIGIILALNPLTLLIYIPGILFMFNKKMVKFRPLILSILISCIVLAFSKGKAYYFFPIFLTLFPFGAICWEKLVLLKNKWIIYPLSIVLFSGFLLIGFGLPVFSLESYIKYEYPYEKKEVEGGKYGIKFEERYSEKYWAEVLTEVKSVYDSLPDLTKNELLIWAKHYRQAGAVQLFRDNYDLPSAFSLHGSFYNWIPKGEMPQTILAFRDSEFDGKDFFEPFFEEVIPVKSIHNPYAHDEDDLWTTIFICKNPKQDFDTLKKLFADRIFE